MKILVIHGPNLNLLGTREPSQYGTISLQKIDEMIHAYAEKEKITITTFQTNSESCMIDELHNAIDKVDGIIINPGAFTHTSIALRDAIIACNIPTLEVHLSNIYKREDFRKKSYISDVAVGVITGFRENSYLLALQAIIYYLKNEK